MDIKIYDKHEGNTYVKTDDKLVWCKLISANLTFDKDLCHYKMHYVLQTEGGVVAVDDSEIHLYSKDGIEWQKDCTWILHSHTNIKVGVDADAYETYEVVVFDGITPIRQKIRPLAASWSYENDRRWEITWDNDYNFHKDCYEDEKECAKWNRCLVREQDGSEHFVEGPMYKLKLKDEQIKAVKKFEKACDDLDKAGLTVIIGEYGEYALVVPKDVKNDITTSYDNPGYGDENWDEVGEKHLYECQPLAKIICEAKYSEDNATWLKVEG